MERHLKVADGICDAKECFEENTAGAKAVADYAWNALNIFLLPEESEFVRSIVTKEDISDQYFEYTKPLIEYLQPTSLAEDFYLIGRRCEQHSICYGTESEAIEYCDLLDVINESGIGHQYRVWDWEKEDLTLEQAGERSDCNLDDIIRETKLEYEDLLDLDADIRGQCIY